MSVPVTARVDDLRPRATVRPLVIVRPPTVRIAELPDSGDTAVAHDLLGLSTADLRALMNRICRLLEHPAEDGTVDVQALLVRRHQVTTELGLRDLSVAPGRPAIWAV